MDKMEFSPGVISVIIPALGFDSFLRVAVNSVLDDGHDRLEVVVVIDGPNSELPGWIMLQQVTVFFTGKRSGAAAALNLGILNSTGEYIGRLDADDVSLPGRFARQVREFENDPSLVLVGAAAELIDDAGNVIGDFYVRPSMDRRTQLLKTNPFVHSSILVRHSIIREAGLYDEQCIRMQDYELILRLARTGPVTIIPQVLVRYRVHGDQSSKTLSGFIELMIKISLRRRELARQLGRSTVFQSGRDLLFAVAQLLRYSAVRKPRYLKGTYAE